MKKVAIWSSLKFTNYGDDLQALAYAMFLKNEGYEVKLFQLDKGLAEMYGVETVQTIDELCKDVKLCIIAGGGLLSPFDPIRRVLNRAYAEWELMFKELYRATKQYGTLFCAISMGGDGKDHNPLFYYGKWRRKFFSSPNFLNGAVRLEGDVAQMKKYYNKDFKHFPDMLFKSIDYFEPKLLEPSKKIRVGLNFKTSRNWHYLDRQLVADMLEYAKTHDDIEFHFTTTHMDYVGLNYQYYPEHETENLKIDKYMSPGQLLGVLSSCDVFVTSMLHLGLTGLCNGTPFLSYRGPGKAKSFLRSVKGDWAILDDHISFKELRDNYLVKKKEDLYNRFDIDAIKQMKKESEQNYQFCKQICEKYA